jgi:excisionase family DNA binding protein
MSAVGQTEGAGWNRPLSRLLDEQEAAEYLHCSVAFLRRCRLRQKEPQFARVGRLVRYRPQDLEAFIDKNVKEVAA